MFYVYVLELERPNFSVAQQYGGSYYYVGMTAYLERRLAAHMAGRGSKVTRKYGVKRVCDVYTVETEEEAFELERQLQRSYYYHGPS